MKTSLGINTGFAVNRYSEPNEWTRIISEAGCRNAQLTADIINVSLPKYIIKNQIKKINLACKDNGINISSCFTGAFTRVNHLAHPDKEIRKYWILWFKKFADLCVELNCFHFGSHFGIFTLKDDRDEKSRNLRRNQNIEGWHEIADYSKSIGIKTILWEPMSISREQGETIKECKKLQKDVNKHSPLPFKLCLDVDHGDLSSPNPADTDPYSWLYEFAKESQIIHLKQSTSNKGGHWPFIDEYNKEGNIIPKKVLQALKSGGCKKTEFILEISFKEREPFDRLAPKHLTESVKFWQEVNN